MERTLYHGTSANQWRAIQKDGLIPGRGKGADYFATNTLEGLIMGFSGIPGSVKREPSVFISSSRANAHMFAEYAAAVNRSRPVVLEVTVDDSMPLIEDEKAPQRKTEEWYRCECVIPPSRIREIRYTKAELVSDWEAGKKKYLEMYGNEAAMEDGIIE